MGALVSMLPTSLRPPHGCGPWTHLLSELCPCEILGKAELCRDGHAHVVLGVLQRHWSGGGSVQRGRRLFQLMVGDREKLLVFLEKTLGEMDAMSMYV